jgi:formate dehydrogenase iron-sulfur subunit
MALQSLDIIRRSATTLPEPEVRIPVGTKQVAKLIDVTKCIGCKACQVACMEWNDLRGEIGTNIGQYQNPHDLDDSTWTLMRFAEVENTKGDLEWLIRKDGCMHCQDPGCLKACPSPGAIVQYSNGIVDFHEESCIGCGYCVTGCPFDIPRISKKDHKAYKCTLCSDRVAVGLEPACIKSCPTGALVFGTKEDMKQHAGSRTSSRAALKMPDFTIPPASAVLTSCTCSTTPTSRSSTVTFPRIRTSARWSAAGKASRSPWRSRPWPSPR